MAKNGERKGRPDNVDGVIVCGLPHSGNRMTSNLCKRVGFSDHTIIWHGPLGPKKGPREWIEHCGPNIRAVIPVRDSTVWNLSWGGRRIKGFTEEDYRAMVMRELVNNGVPTMIFTYESIVRDYRAAAERIYEFLQIPVGQYPPVTEELIWGAAISDGNARHLEPDAEGATPAPRAWRDEETPMQGNAVRAKSVKVEGNLTAEPTGSF